MASGEFLACSGAQVRKAAHFGLREVTGQCNRWAGRTVAVWELRRMANVPEAACVTARTSCSETERKDWDTRHRPAGPIRHRSLFQPGAVVSIPGVDHVRRYVALRHSALLCP